MRRLLSNCLPLTLNRSLLLALLILAPCLAVAQDGSTLRPGTRPAPGTPQTKGTAPYLPPWNFMSLSTAGLDTFQLANPTADGRGVLLLIFDTGVDMGIPGLQKTSTGLPKVIDAVDFSESNLVRCVPATLQGDQLVADSLPLPLPLRGVGQINGAGTSGGEWFVGVMDEARYRNASVRDFDGDGESASQFGVALHRGPDGWRVVVDTDADSSLAGEQMVGNYRDRQQSFTFRQRDPERKAPLTFAATIDTAARAVSFHYDMGGHGTHVAGITAGFGVSGESGFNGVAPGAQIISGKFSGDFEKDNTVTGSMKRAYQYAARLADSLQNLHTPVVVNMSFGIGSAYEGEAEIERFIDDLLADHPNLYVVTSAGNEGPGISTVGIPASSRRIITVGAMLPRGIGRDSYGAALDRDVLWDFSSRGGEVDKPDVVAPGTAISTVPTFEHDARASGTSMASPWTAGVVAVLLSALKQEDSLWTPTQGLIRRALRQSARPLPGILPVEQGAGGIDVRRALDLLRRWRKSGFAADVQEYVVRTFSPNYPDKSGPVAFFRTPFTPGPDWRQTFTITRDEPRWQTRETDFFRAFTLQPNVPWMKTIQKTVYLRNSGVAEVDVQYDREKLREPGIYTGRVIARRASAKAKAPDEDVEFELVSTIIVPYTFSPDKDFTVTTPPQQAEAGLTRRFYFAPPAGAMAMTFTLSTPKGSRTPVSGWVMDHNGYNAGYLSRAKGTERTEASTTIAASALGDGVIEVVVQADPMDGVGEPVEFTLSASCLMLTATPEVFAENGKRFVRLQVMNTGTTPMEGSFQYTVKGYGRVHRLTMEGDRLAMPLTMRKGDGALWVTPRFTPEGYMKSTDILARIVDNEGYVQADEAFNRPAESLFIPNFNRDADSTAFNLEIIVGAADYEDPLEVPIEVQEHHVYPTEPRTFSGGGGQLIPYVPITLKAQLPEFSLPEGYYGIGEITYKPRSGNAQSVTMEFLIES